MILAITGATGFVGSHLVDQALAAGHEVRAMTRREQPARERLTWVPGNLSGPGALVDGADAVIHVAGIVNATDRAGFTSGNIDGTRSMIAAANDAGVMRFVHVSSLAAREPALSDYGWSKAEAEHLVEASATNWAIVRPPAIYGPGDLDQLDLFKLARKGLALLPPPGRLSLIAVDDLARLLLALAADRTAGMVYEADDGTAGLTSADYARAIGTAVGQRVLPLHLPRGLLSLAATLDRRFRGARAKLTHDRVAYLCHPDWTIDPARRPPPALWTPQVETRAGLADTARWYRAKGLL